MRILVADDDRMLRRILDASLRSWGHEVVTATDGLEAWAAMQRDDAPGLVILDWMMPGLDGVEICRLARARSTPRPLYIILLTARTGSDDVVKALDAGADDYVAKPFVAAELRARVGAGVRIVQLRLELELRVAELERAVAHVVELHGILPVCAYCKRIRSDADSWHQMEAYITAHSGARFSHGICPECEKTVVAAELEASRSGLQP